jgi:hypothetical protein
MSGYRLDVVRMTRLIDQMRCCGARLERAIARCDPDPPTWHFTSTYSGIKIISGITYIVKDTKSCKATVISEENVLSRGC